MNPCFLPRAQGRPVAQTRVAKHGVVTDLASRLPLRGQLRLGPDPVDSGRPFLIPVELRLAEGRARAPTGRMIVGAIDRMHTQMADEHT